MPSWFKGMEQILLKVGCGQKGACLPSATNSSVPLATWIAAAGASYFFNLVMLSPSVCLT